MRPHATPRLLTGALGGLGAGGPGPPQGWTLWGEARREGVPQGPNTAAPGPQAEAVASPGIPPSLPSAFPPIPPSLAPILLPDVRSGGHWPHKQATKSRAGIPIQACHLGCRQAPVATSHQERPPHPQAPETRFPRDIEPRGVSRPSSCGGSKVRATDQNPEPAVTRAPDAPMDTEATRVQPARHGLGVSLSPPEFRHQESHSH